MSIKRKDEIIQFVFDQWEKYNDSLNYAIVFPTLIHSMRWKYDYLIFRKKVKYDYLIFREKVKDVSQTVTCS